MKGIKISEYINFIKPEYVYLKLTPTNSVKNNSTHNIAKTISSLHKNVTQNIKTEKARLIKVLGKEFIVGTKYSVNINPKVSYYIYMEKKKTEFYFIVPKQYLSIVKEKMIDTWTGITIKEAEDIPIFKEPFKYQLVYSKEDGLSLAVDNRSNVLLESNLNIMDILEEDDRVGIFYNFIPTSQHSWLSEYKTTLTKIRKELPTDRNKMDLVYLFKYVLAFITKTIDELGEVIAGANTSINRQEIMYEQLLRGLRNTTKQISDATVSKGRDAVLKVQIVVMSESKDRLRQRNNAKSLAQSFNSITEDNSLSHRFYKGKDFNLLDTTLKQAEINKMSTQECSNFIALPGRELLERHKCIEKINTLETEIPEELLQGKICLGKHTFKGKKQDVFMSTDFDYQMLSYVIIGPNRAGKSKFLANIAKNAIDAGECVIIPDFIGSCQLSEEIATAFPKTQILEVKCDNWDTLQGLGYNEVPKSNDPFIQYKNAKEQTALLMTLVDSINADDANFTAKMGRYFESASLAVFLSNGNIKDVFAVLMNHKIRKEYISRIPESQRENMAEYVDYLLELNDIEKGEVVGTRTHLITGAIDRLQKLKVNAYLEMMLKKGSKNNIDLVKEMQKNQLIVIKMPQRMFLTDNEKDVYVTYWLTKVWLALQIREEQTMKSGGSRKDMVKVNLIIDELYQTHNAEKFLKIKLSQLPKFNLKAIISCHYLSQIKIIREELFASNSSYMLISGSNKKNFEELKSELYPYTEEDLLNLPRFNSLNLIKCNEGYSKFITALPKPITN